MPAIVITTGRLVPGDEADTCRTGLEGARELVDARAGRPAHRIGTTALRRGRP